MALKYITECDFKGKKVIARFDFNVPFSKDGKRNITDTTRIDEALASIKFMLEAGASKIVMCSHLGRPKGGKSPEFSLEPVAKCLAEKLSLDVILTESCTDRALKSLIDLPTTKLVLLENLRFHPEEEENDPDFCRLLASYGEIYVNDAFGSAHRKHASVYGIAAHFKNRSYGGFLMKKEIEALSKIVENPASPFVAVVGGAKISDKIKIIERLLTNVDHMLIGGAMAYPFLKAKGHSVGKSLCANEDVELAKKILASKSAGKIILPIDHMASTSVDGAAEIISTVDIADPKMGLDIGPKSLELYKSKLSSAKTVLWNGPMGYFENKVFATGTMEIAKHLATLKAFTLVGGGDSVSAVNKSGVASKLSHISTGGGASLEFIEEGTLPGVSALKFGV